LDPGRLGKIIMISREELLMYDVSSVGLLPVPLEGAL
jgi:hypothetical protein